MNYETILFEKEDEIGIVTLNRPERKNALNEKLKRELSSAFDQMDKDPEIKAVILTGGRNVFCAGADIKERANTNLTPAGFYFSQMKMTQALFSKIENFEKPVIAAISGVAVGGGFELSLVADLRIASVTALFGLPEVNIGVIPAGGGTQRLSRLIGTARAKELLFTGDMITAEAANILGIVNWVIPLESFMKEAKILANKLAAKPPLSMKFAKRAVNVGMQLDLTSAIDYETACAAILIASEDRIEGFNAFVEKRRPVYKGR